MDILVVAGLSIIAGIIFVAMGLSFLSQSLQFENFNSKHNVWGLTAIEYYDNPLCRLKSKYFYYRPKGAVVVSKDRWKKIEKGVNVCLAQALEEGIVKGRRGLAEEMREKIRDKRLSQIVYLHLD